MYPTFIVYAQKPVRDRRQAFIDDLGNGVDEVMAVFPDSGDKKRLPPFRL
jgi:hypothetical protein